MMHQDDPQEHRARIRDVPERRLQRKPYEPAYLMKLGGLKKAEALVSRIRDSLKIHDLI